MPVPPRPSPWRPAKLRRAGEFGNQDDRAFGHCACQPRTRDAKSPLETTATHGECVCSVGWEEHLHSTRLGHDYRDISLARSPTQSCSWNNSKHNARTVGEGRHICRRIEDYKRGSSSSCGWFRVWDNCPLHVTCTELRVQFRFERASNRLHLFRLS